jgi:hypothetical protein
MKRYLGGQYMRKHVNSNEKLVKCLTFVCYEEVLFSYINNMDFLSDGCIKRASLLFMKYRV